ncbi:MAG: Type 1 glutamine amidotransferase-like domain-containing protein [Pirellula sp.]
MHWTMFLRVVYFASACVALVSNGAAQIFDERFDDWPVDLKINGTIVAGESANAELLQRIVASQDNPKAILITNEMGSAKDAVLHEYHPLCSEIEAMLPDEFNETHATEVGLLIWHDSRAANSISRHELERIRPLFAKHIHNGKTLVAIGPASRALSQYFVVSVSVGVPSIVPGMNLLPDCVLETSVHKNSVGKQQLLSVLAAHPRCVGIGLDANTMLILKGRRMQVAGSGQATLLLGGNERQPVRSHSITEPKVRDRSPENYLVDLTEWRRDGIDRTLEPFPPAEVEKPFVEFGTLMIVGGGGMPEGLMSQFVESAGGVENAKLVYVPCEENERVAPNQSMVATWEKMGVKHTSFIHTKDRQQANDDEAFLEPLKDATGIWFGGGRQWNLADSYYGTKAHQRMKEVLRRGGVVGGSSAGASIQASYLARATPIENFKIMAPGYERGGLGFIRGVAIDQHFTQRRRQADMTQLVNRYPQLLGIGIDESTAIVVRGSVAQVVGKGKVHFYDRTQKVVPDRPDFLALEEGGSYDLAKRAKFED